MILAAAVLLGAWEIQVNAPVLAMFQERGIWVQQPDGSLKPVQLREVALAPAPVPTQTAPPPVAAPPVAAPAIQLPPAAPASAAMPPPQAAVRRPELALTVPQPGSAANPRLRITASRQSLSVLRAVTSEKQPEGAALFSVRACSIASDPQEVDPGMIEQALEEKGIAVSTKGLATLAVKRSKNKGLSVAAKASQLASIAGPLVLGFAAGGKLSLNTLQIALISAAGSGVQLLQDATKTERTAAQEAGLDGLGQWLSEMQAFTLRPAQCSVRILVFGNYARGSAPAIMIER